MNFEIVIFVLLVNFCSRKTEKITILIGADFQEEFDEIELQNHTFVGGLARMKYVANRHPGNFIYLGNALSSVPTLNLKDRRNRAFAVFDTFTVSAYVFSLNEFSHNKEDFNEFVTHFSKNLTMSNVRISPGDHCVFLSSFAVISYVIESVKRLPTASGLVVQDAVKFLEETATDLFKIGHKLIIAAGCCGLSMAVQLAKETTKISVIISGCSQQLFWNNDFAPENIKVEGKFPIVVKNKAGRNVIVAHIYGTTKFLGKLDIKTQNNSIEEYSGEIFYMYNEILQDIDILRTLNYYNNVPIPSRLLSGVVRPIGKSAVFLNGQCHKTECNLGNLIADAFVLYKSNIYTGQNWTDTPIGLVSAGMIKASINATKNKGVVLIEDIEEVIPIDDKLVTLTIEGIDLRQALEVALDFVPKQGSSKYLQISGLRVVYDPRRRSGRKLVSVKVRCDKCQAPSYSVLRRPNTYLVVTTESVVTNNFGYKFRMEIGTALKMETVTAREAVCQYIKETKVIYISNSDRILQRARISSTIILKANLYILYTLVIHLLILCTYINNITSH